LEDADEMVILAVRDGFAFSGPALCLGDGRTIAFTMSLPAPMYEIPGGS
jgi:hypothetical protein